MDFDPKKVAEYEVGWWRAHNQRNYENPCGVIELMTKEYMELYRMDEQYARECVLLRVQAAKEHDCAEEKGIDEKISEEHWKKCQSLLEKHFTLLKEKSGI